MLDHVFTDAIGALRDALERALLERQAFEERFQSDILLGDLTWETSYGLPGEGSPPRVRVDITLDWPTWAQTAYRSWYIGDDMDEGPRIEIEIVLGAGTWHNAGGMKFEDVVHQFLRNADGSIGAHRWRNRIGDQAAFRAFRDHRRFRLDLPFISIFRYFSSIDALCDR